MTTNRPSSILAVEFSRQWSYLLSSYKISSTNQGFLMRFQHRQGNTTSWPHQGSLAKLSRIHLSTGCRRIRSSLLLTKCRLLRVVNLVVISSLEITIQPRLYPRWNYLTPGRALLERRSTQCASTATAKSCWGLRIVRGPYEAVTTSRPIVIARRSSIGTPRWVLC